MIYDRTVIAFHGCDQAIAENLLAGKERLRPSQNPYDWLGWGIYFWEYGPDRAWRFSVEQSRRKSSNVSTPAVVGAVIRLGRCFDLLDTRFTHALSEAYPEYRKAMRGQGARLPVNTGGADGKLRYRDCAVLNWYLEILEDAGQPFDTVRGCFMEGGPCFPKAGIRKEAHVQLAVRNPSCVVGVFRPTLESA
jgi:hypothetical protein